MLTLKDIAAHVGVSISTVSLVLNDRASGRVNAEMSTRIREVAAEMGYVPNQLARSLKTRQTHTIGLVSDEVATVPFAGHMLAGAQQTAWDEGYLLLLIDTAGNRDMQGEAVKSLLQRNIEALIIATSYHQLVELPLVPSSVPMIVLDGRPSDNSRSADFVVPDETAGAKAAVQHLIDAGHRRIGFCYVPARYPLAASLRRRGYELALAEAGIPLDEGLIVEATDANTADSIAPARDLLDRENRPTAVFCFGDQIAMGFYQVARELGLDIPTDLSVIGFDNQQFVAESLFPGLTTVQLPHTEMGRWATERALARVRGDESSDPVSILMPCPLVIRESVTAPKPAS